MVLKPLYALIRPTARDEDAQRRELITNVLLLGSLLLTVVATVSLVVVQLIILRRGGLPHGPSPLRLTGFFLMLLGLYGASRMGFHAHVSLILIGLFFAAATYTTLRWGIELPQGQLTYVFTVVLASALLGGPGIFTTLVLVTATVLTLYYLQSHGVTHPSFYWKSKQYGLDDIIVAGTMLVVITVAFWLSHRESMRSLRRARASEAALREQRNLLEATVQERTKQLKESQARQLTHINSLAEFGRLAAGVLHDIAGPLTVLGMSLSMLRRRSERAVGDHMEEAEKHVERAAIASERIQRIIKASQRQVQRQDERTNFAVAEEVRRALQLFEHRALEERIVLKSRVPDALMLYGNPVRFSQAISNLISNAINAYETLATRTQRDVEITAERSSAAVIISVEDWGEGISVEHLSRIFEPLFTTRSIEKGTGIGLTVCKTVVEEDFHGTITVESERGKGTRVTLRLPVSET